MIGSDIWSSDQSSMADINMSNYFFSEFKKECISTDVKFHKYCDLRGGLGIRNHKTSSDILQLEVLALHKCSVMKPASFLF